MMSFFKDDSDEEDVETALVCPTQAIGEPFKEPTRAILPAEGREKKESFIKVAQKKFTDSTFRCVFSTIILMLVFGVIVLCFFYCQYCLFGILVLSACMSAYESYWQIPMWVSMLLIILFGITIVHRDVTLIWK